MYNHIARATARLFTTSQSRFATVYTIKGSPEQVEDKNVRLRGIHIKSDLRDAPNMIFFPEVFDKVENWIPFFTNPLHRLSQQRNIYVLYPRNLGTSDRTAELNYIDMADDVARFMWENKISTATLAGHGIGGKLALAVGCYHAERVTGIMALDTAPMNQHYIESYQELNSYLSELRHFNTNRSLTNISNDLKKIKCPKWRELFQDNLVKSPQGFTWNFNLEAWAKNLGSGTAESLLNWTKTMGLWVGKTMFAFPEHSRYVYLNTHTLPMQNVCTQLQGFHKDIFSIQGDENPLSHWFYEYEDQGEAFAAKMAQFLRHYDGIHVLLKNRSEVGEYYLRDTPNRVTSGYFYTDYLPEHLHHNWRYQTEEKQPQKKK